MFPVYGYTNLHPQRGQQPLNELHQPRWDAILPPMMADPMNHPLYEHWPHNHVGSPAPYPYSYPCHYSFRPPQPHFSPPPYQYSSYGAYPVYPEPYPAYHVPPPYLMGQPRYEYEKGVPQEHHCCGCHHRPSSADGDKNVKIGDENKSDFSLHPAWFKGFPHPIMWIPSGQTKRTDQEKESVQAAMQQKGAAEDPNTLTGWFPLNMKGVKPPMLAGEDGNIKGLNSPSPFPIFWMPCGGLGKNDMRNEETNGDGKLKLSERADDSRDKHCITVEMDGLGNSCKRDEDDERKSGVEDKENKESAKGGAGKKASSPTKSTKLPPVCLRVDPLPKKKNGNGTSRSPSPSGRKEEQTDDEAMKSKTTTNDKSKEQRSSKKDIKVVDVRDMNASAGKASSSVHENKEIAEVRAGQNKSRREGEGEYPLEGGEENPKPATASKPEIKILSGTEAAVAIQSAYRGYEVRRCEPLKKLKQIAGVREKAAEIRSHFQSLESGCGVGLDIKQKAILGETIMNLLLELDTVQGLHPSLRDMRKAVAKELLSLQVKLDALVAYSCAPSAEEMSTAKVAEAPLTRSTLEEGPVGGENEAKTIEQDGDSDLQEPSSVLGFVVPTAVADPKVDVPEEEKLGLSEEMATSLAQSCSESAEVYSPIEHGDPGETEKDGMEILKEALGPSLDSRPVIGEQQKLVIANLSGAPDEEEACGHNSNDTELPDKATIEEFESLAELSQAVTGERDELMHTVGSRSMLNLEKELESIQCSLPRVANMEFVDNNAPEAINIESVVELAGQQQSTVVLDSEAHQVNDVQGPCSKGTVTTMISMVGVDQENQILESLSCEKSQTLNYKAPTESVVDSAVDRLAELSNKEVESSNTVAHQLLVMPEATKEGTELPTALAPVEKGSDSAMEKAIDTVDEGTTLMLEASKEDAHVSTIDEDGAIQQNEENFALHVDPEEEEHNAEAQMKKTDDATSEISVELCNDVLRPLETDCTVSVLAAVGNEKPGLSDDKRAHVEQKVDEDGNVRAVEESEKLKEVMEKLIMVGKEQEALISNLYTKVKDLEKKLARRQKLKTKWPRSRVYRAMPVK
ncbi:Large proline-rich protein bag6 [Dionaea muscipula]